MAGRKKAALVSARLFPEAAFNFDCCLICQYLEKVEEKKNSKELGGEDVGMWAFFDPDGSEYNELLKIEEDIQV